MLLLTVTLFLTSALNLQGFKNGLVLKTFDSVSIRHRSSIMKQLVEEEHFTAGKRLVSCIFAAATRNENVGEERESEFRLKAV